MTQVYKSSINHKSFSIKVISASEIEIDGHLCTYDLSRLNGTGYSLLLDGSSFSVQVVSEQISKSLEPRPVDGEIGKSLAISVDGSAYSVCVDDNRSLLLKSYFSKAESAGGVHIIRAPMPGLISRRAQEVR